MCLIGLGDRSFTELSPHDRTSNSPHSSSTALEYREWQDNIKKDLKRPTMIGETEGLLKEIQRIREEKLKAQLSNDDMER